MNAFESIKHFYRPLQPSVATDGKQVIYQEVLPEASLQYFVYCFWQLKTSKKLDAPFVYRVVSDGCIDIFFNQNVTSESFVMGFCRKYAEFPIGNEFNYIGIRFLPSVFPLVFNIDAKALSNQDQKLRGILPDIARSITEKIHPNQEFTTVVKQLHQIVAPFILNINFDFDNRFYKALHLIFKTSGNIETENGLDTGLSPRQLRRLFNYYIGTTPKAFGKVVRFQHFLNMKPSTQSLKSQKLFYDVGFYDQAHFIKDFKTFYGVTPSRALK
ncbi:AraC family transcriptional regulator [Hyunsoonleella sp. SJ7]|uniref:AraC family transcriptional regulator n=1 Tax=Hyunsoonleella aquatilis TaxID=2762758 RepID=A0A923H756_9FLAO|nr:helix-turn-helix domain-containing protein [Hyunsoonleella aquatilis]MBC3756985.1 AraC family transcriptional regulator [Hyunsoonleella aquatilis]